MERVVTINPFEVPKGQEEEALAMWESFADYFRRQPGYLTTKLHRALGGEAKFHLVSISEWESPERFTASLQNPELQEIAESARKDIQNFPAMYQVLPLSSTCKVVRE